MQTTGGAQDPSPRDSEARTWSEPGGSKAFSQQSKEPHHLCWRGQSSDWGIKVAAFIPGGIGISQGSSCFDGQQLNEEAPFARENLWSSKPETSPMVVN